MASLNSWRPLLYVNGQPVATYAVNDQFGVSDVTWSVGRDDIYSQNAQATLSFSIIDRRGTWLGSEDFRRADVRMVAPAYVGQDSFIGQVTDVEIRSIRIPDKSGSSFGGAYVEAWLGEFTALSIESIIDSMPAVPAPQEAYFRRQDRLRLALAATGQFNTIYEASAGVDTSIVLQADTTSKSIGDQLRQMSQHAGGGAVTFLPYDRSIALRTSAPLSSDTYIGYRLGSAPGVLPGDPYTIQLLSNHPTADVIPARLLQPSTPVIAVTHDSAAAIDQLKLSYESGDVKGDHIRPTGNYAAAAMEEYTFDIAAKPATLAGAQSITASWLDIVNRSSGQLAPPTMRFDIRRRDIAPQTNRYYLLFAAFLQNVIGFRYFAMPGALYEQLARAPLTVAILGFTGRWTTSEADHSDAARTGWVFEFTPVPFRLPDTTNVARTFDYIVRGTDVAATFDQVDPSVILRHFDIMTKD